MALFHRDPRNGFRPNPPPAIGTASRELARFTLLGREVVLRQTLIAPGGRTGWHFHDGTLLVLVTGSALDHPGLDCAPVTKRPWRVFREPSGRANAHLARNSGPNPLRLTVLYINPPPRQPPLPQRSPTTLRRRALRHADLMIEVVTVSTEQDLADAYAIRVEVFVTEQGVPRELELDELDATADHFLARFDGEPVGAGRLLVRENIGVLGRLAVLKQTRGTGLGVALVRAIEDRARQRGLTAVELHSQTQAQGFYERLGYTAYGDIDDDAGIPHIWMRKTLN
ncbi:GNAT family N-acetyltransferase [Nocardia crassostreae]|uniref:GNAT family N-acetyltransferase n=1 Tax=Nocardia crassostreae TaxID=53428 RepID=UPI000B21950D|nr:GNAT family N-acetyltransferase [Nocardia crassostreae]